MVPARTDGAGPSAGRAWARGSATGKVALALTYVCLPSPRSRMALAAGPGGVCNTEMRKHRKSGFGASPPGQL